MKKTCFILMLLALVYLLPAQNSPLTLISPNGGEVWNTGSTYAITWTQVNLAGNASLILLSGNDPASTTIMIAQSVPVTAGQFNWTIPPAILSGVNYKVRINLATATGTLFFDISDGVFTIQGGTDPPPQTYISVTSPNGGEQWPVGSTQTITWNYANLTGEVSIGLIGANTNTQIIIAPSVPIDAQNFQWTVPANFSPGLYKVHIVWLTLLAVYFGDLSDDFFAITNGTPPPPPMLQVTAPNGGEIWSAGTMHPITWNYFGNAGFVLIQLIGGPEMTPINIIANNVPADSGLFNWLIPPYQMPGDAYQVQIQMLDPAGTFIADISDAPFSITAGNTNTPWITVVTPNGGEQWAAGSTHAITWNYANLTGEVYIALIGANTNAQTIIAPSVPIADQTWHWTIPATIPPGPYKVHIVWLSVLDIYIGDQSDGYFQIVNDTPPPPQNLVLTSPNGGEIWTIGATYPITWISSTLAGFVSLALVGANNPAGANVPIAQGIPVTDQSFAWTIPNMVPPANNYRVRITLTSPNGILVQDFSDGVFAIQAGENPPPQTLNVTSPNGGETWAKGTWHDITWTDTSNSSAVRIFLVWDSPNNPRRLTIARNVPNTGTFSWFIPLRLPVGIHYRIAVKSISGALDLSDGQFSVVSPVTNLSARPNPTPAGTTLSFEVIAPVTASVRLYNVKGQIVRTLVDSQVLSGRQTITWDGMDQSGRKVAPGIYFARITSPEFNASHKIIMLK